MDHIISGQTDTDLSSHSDPFHSMDLGGTFTGKKLLPPRKHVFFPAKVPSQAYCKGVAGGNYKVPTIMFRTNYGHIYRLSPLVFHIVMSVGSL